MKQVHITANTIRAMVGRKPIHSSPYFHACGLKCNSWHQAYVVWNGPDGHRGYLADIHFGPDFHDLVKLITCTTCRIVADAALEQRPDTLEMMAQYPPREGD